MNRNENILTTTLVARDEKQGLTLMQSFPAELHYPATISEKHRRLDRAD